MRIGHARHCLTPSKEFYLIGYRSDNRYEPAAGVHDDIYANSLLFEADGKQLFIFSADFLEFEEEMAESVKTVMQEKYGLERDLILLSATHDHSSVVSYHKGWYTKKFDQEYYDFLIQTIENSYLDCRANLKEAKAVYGKKVILGYYGNRNHPGQPADNEVIVLKFLDQDGNAFAGMVNWAVHSTVLGDQNTQLTGDLAGAVCRELEKKLGFYPMMAVGAAGDCSNRNERKGKDFEELFRVSSELAKEIGDIPADREIGLNTIQCQTLFHTVHRADFHLDAKGWVMDLGGMQLFVFPGELGSAFGTQLKSRCPVQGIILGYTNGYYEYFMPKEEYGLSFETKESLIPAGEAEKLVEKFEQASVLLHK